MFRGDFAEGTGQMVTFITREVMDLAKFRPYRRPLHRCWQTRAKRLADAPLEL